MASTKRTKPAAKAETKRTTRTPAPAAKPKKTTAKETAKTPAVKEPAAKEPAAKEPARKPARTRKEPVAAPAPEPATPPPAAPAPARRSAYHAADSDELLEIGKNVLGIKDYRPGQRAALDHVLAGKDVIAVMPTGSGKSLLYQLPSLILPGLTVVVSPLIALIKDQVDKMVAKGVAVVRIDSTLTVRQRREMDALAAAPGGKLLLTTPERMADPEFRAFLRKSAADVGVSRFVVDEAHCVSQWGHDFRPAYLSLRKALEDVGRPPVLATTATAPPHVREDIKHQLGIEDAEIVTTTFDRPNLHYEVITFPGEDDKMKTLVTLLKKLPRPGIVYCATVKKVEELYESLGRHGIPVSRYHGRMTKNDRDAEQERFMEGKDLVMLATNAFGLGVDKKDIRNVLHYHVPGSLESYAQEAGRGGRDGKPSRCVLLFSPDDVAIQEYFLSGTYPTRRQVRAVYEALEAYVDAARGPLRDDTPINVSNIALGSGVGQQRTRTVLSLLKDEGFIIERDGGVYELADPPLPEELLNEKGRQYEARRIMDRQRLDALLAYVKAPGCRNQVILAYLGEPGAPSCGRCDNCLRSKEAALAAATEATLLGATVTRYLDEDGAVEVKPRKLMRHRVVRIDHNGATVPAAAPPPAPPPPAPAPTVRTRKSAAAAPPPVPVPMAPAPPPAVRRRNDRVDAAPAPAPVSVDRAGRSERAVAPADGSGRQQATGNRQQATGQ